MQSASRSSSVEAASQRGIGVLLHPTAFPDSPVCGGFGAAARAWLTSLARHGISVWQVLPVAPTDGTGSPYSSPSSFAINPWLLDAQDLVDQGFLPCEAMAALPGQDQTPGDAGLDCALAEQRADALAVALQLAWPLQSAERHAAFARWCAAQASWLEDHVMFMELRRQHQAALVAVAVGVGAASALRCAAGRHAISRLSKPSGWCSGIWISSGMRCAPWPISWVYASLVIFPSMWRGTAPMSGVIAACSPSRETERSQPRAACRRITFPPPDRFGYAGLPLVAPSVDAFSLVACPVAAPVAAF